MKTITIIRQLSTTIAMLLVHIHVHAVNGFGGLDGSDRSCYCGQFTNLLICEDPDDKQICFCNEDGNVYCDKKVPDDIIDEPAPPVQELAELLLVAEIYTVDGCFCDDVTNVLSCDHPLKEEYCFCNEDGGSLRCSTDTPPIGSPAYSTPTKEEIAAAFAISSFICDNEQMEIEHDAVIRVGDSVRVCLLPQDTTSDDRTSINEITEVTCSNGMDQSFSIIPISVQDERDQVTFEFSNGVGRGFETIIKREYTPFSRGYRGVSFTCSGSVSLSTTTTTRRRRHLVETTSAVEEAFSLSVNIVDANGDDDDTVISGSNNIAKDIGTNLAYIAIIAARLLFL
jgi:hypothetical protein